VVQRYRAICGEDRPGGFLNCVPGVRVTPGAPPKLTDDAGQQLPPGSLTGELVETPASSWITSNLSSMSTTAAICGSSSELPFSSICVRPTSPAAEEIRIERAPHSKSDVTFTASTFASRGASFLRFSPSFFLDGRYVARLTTMRIANPGRSPTAHSNVLRAPTRSRAEGPPR
jgi:hypothetical protein